MSTPQERLRRYELNPRVISSEAVQAVVADIQGEGPSTYLKTLQDRRIEGTRFNDVIHPLFQVWRIKAIGFVLPVPAEVLNSDGIPVETLSTHGPEYTEVPDDQDITLDSYDSINTMRAFVASAFFEEATRQKLPTPEINDKFINVLPAKRSQIEEVVATKPGMFLYVWEEFEERWAGENPDLYRATVQLRDELTDYYTGRMIARYQDFIPGDYMSRVAPEVRSKYSDYLMEYALRTYAMFTPHSPILIEVTNVQPD